MSGRMWVPFCTKCKRVRTDHRTGVCEECGLHACKRPHCENKVDSRRGNFKGLCFKHRSKNKRVDEE